LAAYNVRHKSVGKETGQINRIERFNCTMRQLSNHIGAIYVKILSFIIIMPVLFDFMQHYFI